MTILKSTALVLFATLTLVACGKAGLAPGAVVNKTSGVGIHGFDPVAYHTRQKATQGLARHQTEYQEVVYRFASEQNLATFTQNPDRYLPAYGGYCAYAMSNGDIVDINPRNWAVIDGQLYLNANIFAQGLFSIGTEKKIEKADGHWGTLTLRATSGQE